MLKPSTSSSQNQLVAENEALRARLDEAEETLRAIRSGEVDAIVVSGVGGDQVFTLTGADRPYRALIEDMNEGALTVTMDGLILYANHRFAEMLKTPLEKVIGSTIETWILPDSHKILRALLQNGRAEKRREELTLMASDGIQMSVNLSVNRLLMDELPVSFCMVVTDLTEQNKRAENLARSNTELEQFAYVASHDLQEPLRMVVSYMKLLERRYKGTLDEDADVFIHFAVDGALRMQHLINDLLAYSHVSSHGGELTTRDVSTVMEQVIANLQPAIQESGAIISADPLPTVMADGSQLVQLFQNLIGNALKFRGAAAPCIHISAKREGDRWRFAVADNGIGIEPQYAERIFIIFQRLHNREEYPGTGIGLAICKKIVERHGGRIWLESQPDHGTTFYFTLPAVTNVAITGVPHKRGAL